MRQYSVLQKESYNYWFEQLEPLHAAPGTKRVLLLMQQHKTRREGTVMGESARFKNKPLKVEEHED